MSHPIAAISSLPALASNLAPTPVDKPHASFLQSVNQALGTVSQAQADSDTQSRALIRGAPGASLESAVVAAAHARVDWNATVAVRNEVVNAYRTVMNMPV